MHPAQVILPKTPVGGVITANLIQYFDTTNSSCYPGSGSTVYDLGPNEYDAGLFNYTWDSVNNALVSNGSNSYAGIANVAATNFNLNNGSGDLTVEVWLACDNMVRAGNTDSILAYGHVFGGSGNYQWEVIKYLDGSSDTRIILKIQGTVYGTISRGWYLDWSDVSYTGPTIANAEWFQLVFTWNKATDTFAAYINGVDCGGYDLNTGTLGAYMAVSSTYDDESLFGRYSYPSDRRSFLGKWKIVRVYDAALTASEVLQNFNADKSKIGL